MQEKATLLKLKTCHLRALLHHAHFNDFHSFAINNCCILLQNARKMEAVFRVISIIFISVIMYSDNPIWTWLLGGMFFHLCATWAGWRKKNNYNALLIVLWSCIILLTSIKNLIIPQIFCLAAEHVEQYSMVSYVKTAALTKDGCMCVNVSLSSRLDYVPLL